MPPYRLFGGALSPYTRKVALYLRYKGLEHVVIERTPETVGEFSRLAKLPLLPLLVDARGAALQDSTPMIEVLEERHPEPGISPADPSLKFLSLLIEDFADEWVNKALYHYRWSFEPDARGAAQAIADAVMGDAEQEQKDAAIEQICARMAERRSLVGVSDAVAPVIEGSLRRTLAALEAVLAERPFLLGGRPACADFALAAELEQLQQGPTAGALLRTAAPRTCAWIARLAETDAAGEFLPFEAAAAGLEPLLQEIATVYLPWLQADAQAHGARRERFEVELAGEMFAQAPQRYAATKAYPELRAKRGLVPPEAPLSALLERLGVEAILAPPRGRPETPPAAPADEADEPGAAEDAQAASRLEEAEFGEDAVFAFTEEAEAGAPEQHAAMDDPDEKRAPRPADEEEA